ncbi:YybH family protein [Ramlibacter sp. MMS24-I3-19]|uniref:YybH family protein n=1 Tax=Ramlibacter sp. MMS24-I3-19 TaxID=3416606 RepID=UPI003CFC42DA
MRRLTPWLALVALCGSLAACAVGPAPAAKQGATRDAVFAAERAFARSMADRDLQAFARHVSQEAVFFTTPDPLRGREAVVNYWSRWYSGAQAPFSWEPEQVEVLDSGTLAISSGPVRDAQGKLVARFTSVWRLEPDGHWRVVFDKGNPACSCEAK